MQPGSAECSGHSEGHWLRGQIRGVDLRRHFAQAILTRALISSLSPFAAPLRARQFASEVAQAMPAMAEDYGAPLGEGVAAACARQFHVQ